MRKSSLLSNVIDLFKGIWERWDLRGLMLLSLLLQILLLVLSPLRKRHSKNWLLGSILCLYLVADWSANYAASVIISSSSSSKQKLPLALWSAFLLVHLGGPDSITAFALQDNDFWHRHALALGVQCFSATYVFFSTLAENHLWLPTLLVFFCGFIKYLERTRCLYLACFNNLRDSIRRRPDAGLNYAKVMGLHDSMEKARLPTRFETIEVPPRAPFPMEHDLSDREIMLYAHRFFSVFKRLVVDLKCSHVERCRSRNFFRRRLPETAFRIIALELNYIYEMLFTKANLVNKRLLRMCTTSLVAAAVGLFYVEEKKFEGSDVAITYALLAGAVAMDASYWYSAFSIGRRGPLLLPRDSKPQGRMFYEGWSGLVSTRNVIDYCLDLPKAETQRIMDCFGVSSYFEGLWYVKPEQFSTELRDHIFNEVKRKSELAGDHGILRDTVISARGSFALRLSSIHCTDPLFHYVDEMDYDESLLSWHIATDILFYRDIERMKGSKIGKLSSYKVYKMDENHGDDLVLTIDDQRKISKLLSDYMMYLVTMQPEIMYGVTDMGQTRLHDTRAEIMVVAGTERKELDTITVIRYALVNFCEYLLTPIINAALNLRKLICHADRYRTVQSAIVVCCIFLLLLIIGVLSPITYFALSLFVVVLLPLLPLAQEKIEASFCSSDRERAKKRSDVIDSIFNVNTSIEPFSIKGDQSKSVLYDGCQLAKELDRFELEDRKWEIMSRVWVELLTYAAVRCHPQPLAERLSKGGELISFVWLLMAHFGLMDQFEGKEREFITKIIVGK